MKRILLIPIAAAALSMAGCYDEPAYAPPPPPPPAYAPPASYGREVPPLVQLGERNGFRAGSDDGASDAYYRAGYAPRHDEKYQDAPGYDYRLGPIPPYVEAFRRAYLRGYDRGYNGGGPQQR